MAADREPQAAPLEVEAVLDLVLASAARLFQGEGGSVMLVVAADELEVVCAPGNAAALGARVRFGEGVAGQVAKTCDAVLVTGRAGRRSKPVDSAMCVPLMHDGRLFGVLNINASEGHSFSDHDLVAATKFGRHAADGLASARLYELGRRGGEAGTERHLEAMLAHLADAARVDFVEPRRAVLVDAAKVARDVADEANAQGRVTDVRAPQSVPVLADARHLRRALRELVTNGHQHGEAPVRIIFEVDDENAALTVADGGTGVSHAHRTRAFEPYERLESMDEGGLGLGLTIARRLIESIDGSLVLTETPVGGAAFQLILRRR